MEVTVVATRERCVLQTSNAAALVAFGLKLFAKRHSLLPVQKLVCVVLVARLSIVTTNLSYQLFIVAHYD